MILFCVGGECRVEAPGDRLKPARLRCLLARKRRPVGHGETELRTRALKRVGAPDGLDERIYVRVIEGDRPLLGKRKGMNEAVRSVLARQLALAVDVLLMKERRDDDARLAHA